MTITATPTLLRHPHRVDDLPLLEIPITTRIWRGKRRPCGRRRVFPRFSARLVSGPGAAAARAEGLPPNFYLHPWEIDPGQPRIKGARLRSALRHRIGLSRCATKLDALLAADQWTRMDDAYHGWIDGLLGPKDGPTDQYQSA